MNLDTANKVLDNLKDNSPIVQIDNRIKRNYAIKRKVIDNKIKCSYCKYMLDVSKFHKSKHTTSGYRSDCKICCSRYRRKKIIEKSNSGVFGIYLEKCALKSCNKAFTTKNIQKIFCSDKCKKREWATREAEREKKVVVFRIKEEFIELKDKLSFIRSIKTSRNRNIILVEYNNEKLFINVTNLSGNKNLFLIPYTKYIEENEIKWEHRAYELKGSIEKVFENLKVYRATFREYTKERAIKFIENNFRAKK